MDFDSIIAEFKQKIEHTTDVVNGTVAPDPDEKPFLDSIPDEKKPFLSIGAGIMSALTKSDEFEHTMVGVVENVKKAVAGDPDADPTLVGLVATFTPEQLNKVKIKLGLLEKPTAT